jgi:glutaredoxin-like protein NrdH
MYTVTVYTTPSCARCVMTCRVLDRAGIRYRLVDVAADAAAREYVAGELGYTEAPVVVVDQDEANHWSGFRPEKIATLTANTSNATNTTNTGIGGSRS